MAASLSLSPLLALGHLVPLSPFVCPGWGGRGGGGGGGQERRGRGCHGQLSSQLKEDEFEGSQFEGKR